MGRMLALDWGRVRVGVALSDALGMLATPYDTFSAKPRDQLLNKVVELVHREEVERVIIGLPLNMDGSEGASAQEARRLGEELTGRGLPVVYYDERLSSHEAEQKLRSLGHKPSREKGRVDRAAAAIILQEYLDSHQHVDGTSPGPSSASK